MDSQNSIMPYTCLDLFAGAGGFSLGLEVAGFQSLGAVEIDEIASRSYTAAFGERPVARFGPTDGDMAKIDPDDIRRDLERCGVTALDLLVAGPPCQGFSRVGRGKLNVVAGGFNGDERNQLYRRAILVLQVLRPRVFLFENVAGILNMRGENVAEVVCDAIAKVGYRVQCALLNSAAYGVPQTRERVFIIGVRTDLGVEPRFPGQEHSLDFELRSPCEAELRLKHWRNPAYLIRPKDIPLSENLSPAVTVEQAFDDLPPFTLHLEALHLGHPYRFSRSKAARMEYRHDPRNSFCREMRFWGGKLKSNDVSDHICRWTPRDFETFARMKPGDRYPEAIEIAKERYRSARNHHLRYRGPLPMRHQFIPPYPLDTFPEKWRKLIPNRPSWTVTAHLGRDTYSHIHYDDWQARAITLREAARLQCFPDAFPFAGNAGDMFRQIGNAVPPLLARAIGNEIHRLLRKVDTDDPADAARWTSRVPLLLSSMTFSPACDNNSSSELSMKDSPHPKPVAA